MRKSLTLAGILLLTGCVSNRLPAPEITVPGQFEAQVEASQSNAVSAQSIEQWWLLFDDAQLSSLVDQALSDAPDARTALARLREAQAIRRGALTPYDPQGNPGFSVSRSDTSVNGAPAGQDQLLGAGTSVALGGSFNVSWEADLFGRRSAARGAAEADLAAARFVFEATRLSLAANVATQLFAARGLAGQIVEAQETLRIAQELARIGRLRVTSGLGSGSDAARLDTQLANAQSDLVNLRSQFSIARRTLLVLLGRGTDGLDTLPIAAVLPMPPRPPALTPADVMMRRPDVREAEQRLRAAAGNLKLDQLALFPRLTLQPGASFTRVLDPAAYATSVWTLAAGLFVPILDRPRLLSQIGAQTARGEQAVIAYEQAVQAAYGDAENSLTALSADLDRLDYLILAEQRAQFAFSAQQQGYKAGIVDLDTLLQTEQAWRAARIALVALKTSTLTNAVTSFKALGGGWNPDPSSGS
ncbi:efflux transporter outer membrane subunit [Sphingobium boeckii]|uniref:NodT family efflux transporter outer membrane factor (OMF) lipoprotein n=1 Tax=Sphingobium boeckii TaxID=1082345 RepID=A0A7W9AH06_9SPHN|nr:NodT family efflux transporter outer membrane factor (OMF) lipoprotein [Sphingobium boeckii]